MTQARIHVLPFKQLARIFRGEAALVLPADADIVGVSVLGTDQVGVRVHSAQYPHVCEGRNPPVATATIRTRAEA